MHGQKSRFRSLVMRKYSFAFPIIKIVSPLRQALTLDTGGHSHRCLLLEDGVGGLADLVVDELALGGGRGRPLAEASRVEAGGFAFYKQGNYLTFYFLLDFCRLTSIEPESPGPAWRPGEPELLPAGRERRRHR